MSTEAERLLQAEAQFAAKAERVVTIRLADDQFAALIEAIVLAGVLSNQSSFINGFSEAEQVRKVVATASKALDALSAARPEKEADDGQG